METAALQGDFAHTQKEKKVAFRGSPAPTAAPQALSVFVERARRARGRKEKAEEQRVLLWGKQSARSLLFLPFCPLAIRLGHYGDDGVCDNDDG